MDGDEIGGLAYSTQVVQDDRPTDIVSDISSQIRSPSVMMASSSVKDNQLQMQKLQKLNFDMKLRIFYLEERLAKIAPGNTAPNMAELEEDLFQQRMLCEEKTNQLEERNILLIKARNAIESLQADLEIAKAESQELRNDATHPLVVEKENELLESQKLIEQKDNTIASQTETVQEL